MKVLAAVSIWVFVSQLSLDDQSWEHALNNHFRKQVEEVEEFSYPALAFRPSLKEGDFGKPDFTHLFTILQKVDDERALVLVRRDWKEKVPTADGFGLRSESRTATNGPYMFDGFDFSKNADDSIVKMDSGMMVDGTFEYTNSVDAARTILRIVPIEFPEIPKAPSEVTSEPREWSDRSGKFSVVATYKGFDGPKTLLVTEDGKKIDVTTNILSAEDRRFVRKLIRDDRDFARALEEKSRSKK